MTEPSVGIRGSYRRIKWWQWMLAILAAVGVFVGLQRVLDAYHEPKSLSAVTYEGQVGVPGQVLAPSLRQQPVPGWRIDLKTLFPDVSRPSVGYIGDSGDHAYFTVSYNVRSSGQPKAWLLGVDVANGTTLFPPVEIAKPVLVNCLLNGPTRVLCLNESTGPATGPATAEAWVIDAGAGAVLSHGQTKLRTVASDPADVVVRQAGMYAVASEHGMGWRGIGDQGELTWTVRSSDDSITVLNRRPGDPYTDLAVASVDDTKSVVFSTSDGAVRKEFSKGANGTLSLAVGGFVEHESQDSAEFTFYDANGTKTGSYTDRIGGANLLEGTQLPVLSVPSAGQLLVLDTKGTPMTVVSAESPWTVRFVGETMYTRSAFADLDDAKAQWEAYDLRSGNKISSCPGLPIGDDAFAASDGSVVLGRTGERVSLAAVDNTTCAVLWRAALPSPAWMAGSTLVQADRDTGELISLVPPAR